MRGRGVKQIFLSLVAVLAMSGAGAAQTAAQTPAKTAAQTGADAQAPALADQIARGRYIAVLGDCTACHTAPRGGAEMAGDYAIASPIGTIWSTNITPSRQYGIGDYSLEEFERAVRKGVRKDGAHLYPAMPYDAYSGITDDDMAALYAYMMHGVAPIDTPPQHETALPFPFNLRFSMAGWNLIYARGAPFTPDARLTDQQNRGKYLADSLGHCSSCHSPRNLLMGSVSGDYLRGGAVGPWHAPDISGDMATGIGSWSDAEIATYLKTGRAEGRAQAAGPMAEAVENSFQHTSDADLLAIAAYLKTVSPSDAASSAASSRADQGEKHSAEAEIRGMAPQNAHDSLKSGADLYSGYCASCHQPDGAGSTGQAYPSLFHNTVTGAHVGTNLLATILYGVDRDAGGEHVLMPHFNTGSFVQALSDQEVADVANYVLATYGGGAAPAVTLADVTVARNGGPVAPIGRLQPYILPFIWVGLALLALLIAAVALRRRRR